MLILWCAKYQPLIPYYREHNGLDVAVHTELSFPPHSKGDVVFALGKEVLGCLERLGVVRKGRSLTSLRNIPIELPSGCYLMVSYSPDIQDVSLPMGVEFLTDWMRVKRLARTGKLSPDLGNYVRVDTLEHPLERLRYLFNQTGSRSLAAVDLETEGLDYLSPDARILILSVTTDPGQSFVVYFGKEKGFNGIPGMTSGLWEQIRQLLTHNNIAVTGANFKFDSNWIASKWGIKCTNFCFDTGIVGSLLDENRSNSLKTHAKMHTDLGGYSDEFDQKYDKAKMGDIPLDELVTYAGGDTDATMRVARYQLEALRKQPRLARFYSMILHPAARAYEEVERCGVVVDLKKYSAFGDSLDASILGLKQSIWGLMPQSICDKYKGNDGIVPNMVVDFMFSKHGLNLKPQMVTEKSKAPSTSIDHLEMFNKDERAKPFVDSYRELMATSKMKSTYVTGFLSHLRSDGRLHPTYFLYNTGGDGGTVTGRLSARDPAFQCLEGSSLILTDRGEIPIAEVVALHEKGDRFKVLTHRGDWQGVVGVFRNGVQPIYAVSSQDGKKLLSTGNHPYLTDRGWVTTDKLRFGDFLHVLKGHPEAGEILAPSSLFTVTPLASVESAGEGHTYDLTISESHSFLANGLLVHNTLPKHSSKAKELRQCFVCPPGMSMISSDYIQGELKITACLAHETTMIQAYRSGLDLHALSSSRVAGLEWKQMVALKNEDPEAYSSLRQLGKALNFGLIYGMFAPGFQSYAETAYKVAMSLAEAENHRSTFFRTYPRLPSWHTECREFVRKNKYMETPLGRVRHLPHINSPNRGVSSGAERQGINSAPQATLSDLSLWATALLHKRYGFDPGRFIAMGMVHDQLLFYARTEELMLWSGRVREVMENLPFESLGWDPQLQFTVDVQVGDNMGALKDLKP
jgi:DNA polymerase I-like protein with 3'-5' exonuclease and polymerase domains